MNSTDIDDNTNGDDQSGNISPQQFPSVKDIRGQQQEQQRGAAETPLQRPDRPSEVLEASTTATVAFARENSVEVANKAVQVEDVGGGFHEQEAVLLEKAATVDFLREEVDGLKSSLEVSF